MSFEIVDTTIPDIQAALEAGEITSKQLVLMYYERIADHDKNSTDD